MTGILIFHASEASPIIAWPARIDAPRSALIVWPLAMVVSAVVAAAIGAVSLRTSGVYFIMITLAFGQMLYFFFVSLEGYGGDDGLSLLDRNSLPGLDLADDTVFYYLCLGLLLAFLYASHRIVRSRFGIVIRGCRQNPRRMAALGFHTFRYRLTCFAIAGAGAGLAGALLANQTQFVSPATMHWTTSGEIMVMVILGGMGTLVGPVLGAAALLLAEEFLSILTEHWALYLGPFLILVVLFARRGLYGLITGEHRGDA